MLLENAGQGKQVPVLDLAGLRYGFVQAVTFEEARDQVAPAARLAATAQVGFVVEFVFL